MRQALNGVAVLALIASLAACGEKPQTTAGESRKTDSKAWQSTASDNLAAGYKSGGDKAAWDEQIRKRGVNQNEYVRINN